MPAPLLRLLLSSAAYYAAAELLVRRGRAQHQVQRLLWSSLFVLVAAVLLAVGLVLLIATLFFKLAEVEALVVPALVAGGVSLLAALLLANEGVRRWRRLPSP